jgi:hypothetical protein
MQATISSIKIGRFIDFSMYVLLGGKRYRSTKKDTTIQEINNPLLILPVIMKNISHKYSTV